MSALSQTSEGEQRSRRVADVFLLLCKSERLFVVFFSLRIFAVYQKGVTKIDQATFGEIVNTFRLGQIHRLLHIPLRFWNFVLVQLYVAQLQQGFYLLVFVGSRPCQFECVLEVLAGFAKFAHLVGKKAALKCNLGLTFKIAESLVDRVRLIES